jgi:hypothetical protein
MFAYARTCILRPCICRREGMNTHTHRQRISPLQPSRPLSRSTRPPNSDCHADLRFRQLEVHVHFGAADVCSSSPAQMPAVARFRLLLGAGFLSFALGYLRSCCDVCSFRAPTPDIVLNLTLFLNPSHTHTHMHATHTHIHTYIHLACNLQSPSDACDRHADPRFRQLEDHIHFGSDVNDSDKIDYTTSSSAAYHAYKTDPSLAATRHGHSTPSNPNLVDHVVLGDGQQTSFDTSSRTTHHAFHELAAERAHSPPETLPFPSHGLFDSEATTHHDYPPQHVHLHSPNHGRPDQLLMGNDDGGGGGGSNVDGGSGSGHVQQRYQRRSRGSGLSLHTNDDSGPTFG